MSVTKIIQSYKIIGFSGSRNEIDPVAGNLAAAAVEKGSLVVVGCARGVDEFFRSKFPDAQIYKVDRSLGKNGFAVRSIECVETVKNGLWVSFPGSACPVSLYPSERPNRCFCGSGSGSWASLAYAIGRNTEVLVYLGSIPAPTGWGLVQVSDGWYQFQPIIQKSLFIY
jgi:hypothetical protein